MSSEFSNMKKLPYIPPTSPPPIDSLSEEVDYEIPDYDITGLSQKLCDEDTSVTHQPLESTLDDFDVTVDSNLNSLKDSNSLSKDVFQKIETIMKQNSEEESSSSITIPPLDCEGQSLNDCNISDLENDNENYDDEFDFPRESEVVANDGLACKFESERSSPASNDFCQKSFGEDKHDDSYLSKKLESNLEHVHDNNESEEEKVNEVKENTLDKNDLSFESESEFESNMFNPNFPSLVYDDGGGGRIDSIEGKENVKECSNIEKITENFDDGKFSNFVSESKADNNAADDDDFGDFISKRNINNKIEENDVGRLKSATKTQDVEDNDDFGDFISEIHYEKNEIQKSDTKEIHQNIKTENFREFIANTDTSDNNDQNDDFGNFVCENEEKSTDGDVENFGNFSSNFNKINNEKLNNDFDNLADNKEKTSVVNIGNVTLESRLSVKDNSANKSDFGNSVAEKEQNLDTDDDNDDFGDFYSTNVTEEPQSEVKLCQENYHDEYLDPSIHFESPSKFNRCSSANDAESKLDKKDSLQLEFSDDDEEETVDKDDDEFSHTEEDTVLDPDLKENKFHGYFIRWLPKGSRSTTSGSLSFSKLNELIDRTFIWFHATNLESCSALQFSWTNSRINKLYLSSLNVDTRNILLGHRSKWISTIPIFAQALSFSPLTPLKPSANSVNWNLEESSVNIQSNIPSRLEKDSSKGNSDKDLPVPDIKNIPPAKFDWNSSGLTNPLNRPEKELLSSLEKDFTTTSSSSSSQDFKSSTSVIEEALRKVNSSSSISSTPSVSQNVNQRLPPKVQQIVNSIPDLNFMQSKVMAFPIGRPPNFYS